MKPRLSQVRLVAPPPARIPPPLEEKTDRRLQIPLYDMISTYYFKELYFLGITTKVKINNKNENSKSKFVV